jgi:hypothetical protein|tara:strand:+ start:1325 stop:1726 length:402 start_codon:yes stop_codon:yes gene_type:complete
MYIKKDNIVIRTIRENKNKVKPFVPSKHLITRWANILNEEIFNNIIHPFHDITIKRKHDCHAEHIGWEHGEYVFGELSMDSKFLNKSYFIYTLAHEMIHQWQWMQLNKTDHGKSFMKWKNKLNQFEIPLGVSI